MGGGGVQEPAAGVHSGIPSAGWRYTHKVYLTDMHKLLEVLPFNTWTLATQTQSEEKAGGFQKVLLQQKHSLWDVLFNIELAELQQKPARARKMCQSRTAIIKPPGLCFVWITKITNGLCARKM